MRERTCEVCAACYRPSHGAQRTCGRACGMTLKVAGLDARRPAVYPSSRVHYLNCIGCGALFVSRYAKKRLTCSASCGSASSCIMRRYYRDAVFKASMLAQTQARRASHLGLGDTLITITYLMRRDGARCGICRRTVRATHGPWRPSMDHVIPLSRGGRHELANVQLAHYRCNLIKGNRGSGEQLMIFG